MADAALDTLAVTRHLEARGFTTAQAEAILGAVRAGVTGGVAAKADVTDLRTDVTHLQNNMMALRTDVTDLQNNMTALRTDVTDLQNNMTALRTDVTALRTDVTDLQNNMTALRTDVVETKNDLLWVKRIGGSMVAIFVAVSGFAFNTLFDMNDRLAAIETALEALKP